MAVWIKICANTNVEDALLTAEVGVDAVGFVFAPSKRQVRSEEVESMMRVLPKTLAKVGVFATDDPYEVEHHVACTGLTTVQLHGVFDAEQVRLLSNEFGGELQIVQTVAYAVDVRDRAAADVAFERALRAVFDEPLVWAVLVDAAKSGVSGGLGVAFDWAHVASIVERAVGGREPRPRIILAGGLTPQNVAEAIAAFRPWGVDVASGVEASPGKKDPMKLRAFVEAVRGFR